MYVSDLRESYILHLYFRTNISDVVKYCPYNIRRILGDSAGLMNLHTMQLLILTKLMWALISLKLSV